MVRIKGDDQRDVSFLDMEEYEYEYENHQDYHHQQQQQQQQKQQQLPQMTNVRRRVPMILQAPIHYMRQKLPYWITGATMLAFVMTAVITATHDTKVVRLAMIGNSMMYFNDLPRLLEAMGNGRLKQNSCLHGNADFSSHLWYGNGMYDKWQTGQARLWDIEEYEIYDYGACSPQQLLFGTDERLVKRRRALDEKLRRLAEKENVTEEAEEVDDDVADDKEEEDDDDNDDNTVDDAYGNMTVTATYSTYAMDDDAYNVTDDDAWEYGLLDDRTNPCLMDEDYNDYTEALYEVNGPPHWDFVLFNDNTRSPCCTEQREAGLELLETVYLPWLKQIHAAPIFMMTYGYWAAARDMSGLTDIPTFASLTYEGYRQYANLATRILPAELKPRIAPVGLAFLIVWEEYPSLWQDLIHNDEIHLSPSGTFLEACVVYATIFGVLPDPDVVFGEDGMARLWSRARRMAPPEQEYKPYPTLGVAQYLYHVAHRTVIMGEMPRSLILYKNNESAYFTPDDSAYQRAAESKNRNGQ